MKFTEPKNKTGKPMLGVTITYNPHNAKRRWFINGESVYLEKIALLLGYKSKTQFQYATNKYGVNLIMTKGFDNCKTNKLGKTS